MTHRWLIRGTLTACSAVAISTGKAETRDTCPKAEAGARPGRDDGAEPGILAIDLDCDRRPYLPGSALKGVLRAWLAARFPAGQLASRIERLFGGMPRERGQKTEAGESVKTPLGGMLEVCDAFVAAEDALQCPWIGQTRIDRETGTADPGMLRHQRAVDPGVVFDVEITCDDATPDEIALVLAALDAFRDPGGPRLGGDTGQGLGRMEWRQASISVIDADAVAAWLRDGAKTPWWEIKPSAATQTLVEQALEAGMALKGIEPPQVLIELEIAFVSPFLTADPSRYAGKGHPDKVPRLRAWKNGNQDSDDLCPILSGASVKGALRSRAERIASTISAEPKDVVARIFGSTDQAGRLTVSDFIPIPEVGRTRTDVQEFVAVDRFTGGAAEAKKFQVRAVQGTLLGDILHDASFVGTLRLLLDTEPNKADKNRIEIVTGKQLSGESLKAAAIDRADLGLLALLGRDLIEGDITFGSGAAKGFGACRVEVKSATANAAAQARLAELLGSLPGEIEINGDLLAIDVATWREWLAPAVKTLCSRPTESAGTNDGH